MIQLNNVSKQYDGINALSATNLQFIRGETTILIGPSGCGKSTVLRLINGLVSPDSGEIDIDGTIVSANNINRIRQRMGYVIQEGGLLPHLDVRNNVTLMAHYLKHNKQWIDARLNELAEIVRLPSELFFRYPAELSGGQRQRVSLMRALMLDPDLLLLDEPLGALDPMIRFELQQELSAIFRLLGKTVIMVTHDLAEAAYFGHTLVLMNTGKVVQTGTFPDLVKSPSEPFVEQFTSAQQKPMQKLASLLD